MTEKINFKASRSIPNPKEVDYWIDLTTDPNGSIVKVFKNNKWETITCIYGEQEIQSLIDVKVAELVDSAPSTLNTLNELAAALDDDPNFATTMATELGKKVSSTTVKEIRQVTEIPDTQEPGVLYLKVA